MTVDYVDQPAVPGTPHFRCDRLRAVLAVPRCASMWRQDGATEGRACNHCSIGAEHAGLKDPNPSPLFGSKTCARCHRLKTRLIGKMLCVSCKNREYELLKGSNAKGTLPVKLQSLDRRRVTYFAGERVHTLVIDRSLDQDELIVAVLRDSPHRVAFGFSRKPGANRP